MTSLFRDPGCTCDLVATLGAAVEGEPEPLCDVHDADRISERLQSEIEARMARTEMIADKVAGPGPMGPSSTRPSDPVRPRKGKELTPPSTSTTSASATPCASSSSPSVTSATTVRPAISCTVMEVSSPRSSAMPNTVSLTRFPRDAFTS